MARHSRFPIRVRVFGVLTALVLQVGFSLPAFAQEVHRFDIRTTDAATAIHQFGNQSGVQILASAESLKGKRLNGVTGELSTDDGLQKLLAGTGLSHRYVGDRAVALVSAADERGAARAATEPATQSVAQAAPDSSNSGNAKKTKEGEAPAQSAARKEELEKFNASLPEVLVVGSRILNMDIPRTRDDAQPYVVFERQTIERSGATNLEDFFKSRLPMNTISQTSRQFRTDGSNLSQVNLRGLGANQTLILIDGHRTAGISFQGTPSQADINGIPLDAIERIEVLPTTASGIYGGGATGGAINIILRRGYAGTSVKLTYDNTFESDAAAQRVDLSTGFSLEEGRTNILLAGSYSDADFLIGEDRDFAQRRLIQFANNPASILPPLNPPLGATTNIRSANGSPLFGPGTPSFTSVPAGYAGGGGLAPLLTNAGLYNLDPSNTASGPVSRKTMLLGAPNDKALVASVRREFGARVQGFLDVNLKDSEGSAPTNSFPTTYTLPASAPNNPFGQSIVVTVPFGTADSKGVTQSESQRFVGGVIVQLTGNWTADADYTWDRSKYSQVTPTGTITAAGRNAITTGALDVIRDTDAFPLDISSFQEGIGGFLEPLSTTLKDASLRFAGPVGALPAGRPTLTALLEYRDEEFGAATQTINVLSPPTQLFRPSKSQSIESAYLEAGVPLISSQNAASFAQQLDLQIAVRHDRYTVNGVTGQVIVGSNTPIGSATSKTRSTDPTFGLRYQPMRDIAFRASYGTGFLPPSVLQVVPALTLTTINVTDPLRGNEQIALPPGQTSGGNPDLDPEQSESLSGGLVLTPRFAEGLRLSVDYTRIEKTDNIQDLTGQSQFIVANEALFPGRVIRGPDDPTDPFAVGPITGIDTRSINLAQALVEAWDVALDYHLETTRFGTFDFYALGTWQTHFKTKLLPTQPFVENVGVGIFNPLKLRANAGLTWTRQHWSLGWSARHFDSYAIDNSLAAFGPQFDFVRSQGSERVRSQTYLDLFVTYRTGEVSGSSGGFLGELLDDAEVQLGVRNVLDKEPPYDASSTRLYSLFGDPRLASYYLTVKVNF